MDLQVVWRGDDWRQTIHPPCPPPSPGEPSQRPWGGNYAQQKRVRQRVNLLLSLLEKRPQTQAQLADSGVFGTGWNVRVLIRRLKRDGRIQGVGLRYGKEGPPAIVWGIVK